MNAGRTDEKGAVRELTAPFYDVSAMEATVYLRFSHHW